MTNFDVGIIGIGVAGSAACLKIAKEHKNLKVVAFDLGRPPAKRRRQLEGFLGCLPNSDGKLYLSDIQKVADVIGLRKAKSSFNWFNKNLSNINSFKVIKDKKPSAAVEKKLKKAGYDIILNDYMQIYPKDIHSLSRYIASNIENDKNITCIFDSEVKKIYKQKSMFSITTEDKEYKCKKLIIAVGRSGWRWAKELYSNFGIIDNNDFAKFGIRIELNASLMKDFNKSACSLIKENGELEIGPLNWGGTIIPEDHLDLAISAFRSNENRWKSSKVSFSLIGNQYFENKGFEQTDRIGKLTFLLANDRILKQRVSRIISGKSDILIIKEYDWLKNAVMEFSEIVPEIISKGYFHVPTITPLPPKINLGTNLESEVDGMYVIGESAGLTGILSAAIMGSAVIDNICK